MVVNIFVKSLKKIYFYKPTNLLLTRESKNGKSDDNCKMYTVFDLKKIKEKQMQINELTQIEKKKQINKLTQELPKKEDRKNLKTIFDMFTYPSNCSLTCYIYKSRAYKLINISIKKIVKENIQTNYTSPNENYVIKDDAENTVKPEDILNWQDIHSYTTFFKSD